MNKDNQNYPLITIGVSAYNRKNYLPECLDSLLQQTYPRCEIIVVDDGSTDGTEELMQEKYPQIKYIRKENGGDASAKNLAAKNASGEYIVFNDSDDVFFPDAVERLYKALQDKGNNTCSYGTYQTIDADGKILPTKRKVSTLPSGNITSVLLRHIIVNNCGTLMPLSAFSECGSFNEKLRVGYDWALFLEMSLNHNFYAVQEPVFYRRRHGNNISSASYGKIHILLNVFEDFISRHQDILAPYSRIIKKRLADLHRKLYREAKKEKLFQQAFEHAAMTWKLNHSIKNLCSMAAAAAAKWIH